MNTLTIREKLHEFINIEDERIIRIFYAMATEYKRTESQLKPFTKSEFINDIKEAEQQIENGDYLTIEEFEKEAEQWK